MTDQLEYILEYVPKMEVFERLHLFHILKKYTVKYTRQSSGVLVNLLKVPLPCVEEMVQFIEESAKRKPIHFMEQRDYLEELSKQESPEQDIVPDPEPKEVEKVEEKKTRKRKTPDESKRKTEDKAHAEKRKVSSKRKAEETTVEPVESPSQVDDPVPDQEPKPKRKYTRKKGHATKGHAAPLKPLLS
jgi:hypothetical protein